MKRLILGAACVVAACAMANTQVFRLERDTDTEDVMLVGADGVKRPVVLVSPEEYVMLTGQVAQVWASMNDSKEGRRILHGRETNTEYDYSNGVRRVVYANGYVHTEKMPVRTGENRAKASGNVNLVPQKRTETKKPSGISARHWELRKKQNEVLSKPTKEVTIEHNANTGKDVLK